MNGVTCDAVAVAVRVAVHRGGGTVAMKAVSYALAADVACAAVCCACSPVAPSQVTYGAAAAIDVELGPVHGPLVTGPDDRAVVGRRVTQLLGQRLPGCCSGQYRARSRTGIHTCGFDLGRQRPQLPAWGTVSAGRDRVDGLGGRIRSGAGAQRVDEHFVDGRRPGADGLIHLGMRPELGCRHAEAMRQL